MEGKVKSDITAHYMAEENEDDYYIEECRHIPGIVLKIWGKMNEAKYGLLKKNPSWLKIKVNVCMDCFMKFTSTAVESVVDREVIEQ